MKATLINLVVTTCILLVVASPIPPDSILPQSQSSELPNEPSIVISEAPSTLDPQQNSINAPSGALHPKDSTNSENLHLSDLVAGAGSGSEKLNSNLKKSRKHIKPKRHWLPPDSHAAMPVLGVSLQEAYNNPLEASVEELKGVLEFLDKRRYARMENARTGSKTRYQSERGTVKPATRDYKVKTHQTKIPTVTDSLKLQRELAYLVVTHQFYHRTSGKEKMIETLERERQSESGGAAPSSPLYTAGTPAAGAVPPDLRAARPVLDASLQEAYNNPLKASVDELKGVLDFLDERRYANTENTRIRGVGKYKSETGTVGPTTLKRVYRRRKRPTKIPTITDPSKLQQELAYLVVTNRFYHRTSGKKQMIETLERERQSESGGAATSSAASQQPNTASLSSHPGTSLTPGDINEDVHDHDHGFGGSIAGTGLATGASDPAPEPPEPVRPTAMSLQNLCDPWPPQKKGLCQM
ncbi:hypothetical protein H0H93_007768 [Arthromyces matolae]|nr:hypothetical protein H0H93_007768 [Arthromyces matolae]